VLLRMLVVEQYADLSDREVHEQVGYNLLYRAFVGLGVDEAVPDDTTLVRFRARVGEAGIREVFDALNQQWAAAGLLGTERRVLDGVHLWAKVARQSWVGLLRKGRRVLVDTLAQVDGPRAATLRAQFVPPAEEAEPRDDGALPRESERTAALVAAVADVADATVQARVAQVQTLLRGEGDRVVSFDDPDARWGYKAADKPFLGYKAHESLDPDSRLITAVDVVPGNVNEAVRTDTVLASEPTPRTPGAVIIGDGLYHNATTVAQVEQAGGRPCFSGLKAERVSDAFTYRAETDQMECPEGKRSVGKVRVTQGDLYYFSMRDCGPCPRAATCLTRGEQVGQAKRRRRVYLSDVRKARITMSAEIALQNAAVLGAIEHRAPGFELLHARRSFFRMQLRHSRMIQILTAAHGIGEMDAPVVAIVHVGQRGGDAALGHDRVGLAEKRLANEADLQPGPGGLDGRAQAGAARPDDEDVVLEGLVFSHGLRASP
jgi:IS5 family transposase